MQTNTIFDFINKIERLTRAGSNIIQYNIQKSWWLIFINVKKKINIMLKNTNYA